jgi:hypothetical protein
MVKIFVVTMCTLFTSDLADYHNIHNKTPNTKDRRYQIFVQVILYIVEPQICITTG